MRTVTVVTYFLPAAAATRRPAFKEVTCAGGYIEHASSCPYINRVVFQPSTLQVVSLRHPPSLTKVSGPTPHDIQTIKVLRVQG